MTKVKIYGAGSIGNHLSHAARCKGWEVTLCDVDPLALERASNWIYPNRYGQWDEKITLALNDAAPRGGFDFIFVGTPPDSHVPLALEAIDERPKAILVEKPFALPSLTGCQALYDKARAANIRVFVGYDHVVAKSLEKVAELAMNGLRPIQTIDVAFREHWQGIFDAHPWLSGPNASYLGHWRRGGGALGEHSHALNMWQHLAHLVGAGRVVAVSATLDYVQDGEAEYDRLALLNLETENGIVGRVVQDVLTRPPLKWARLQRDDGAIEWACCASPYEDVVRNIDATGTEEMIFKKSRPQDFIQELDHIERVLQTGEPSPISIDRGLESMLVIAAGHKSASEGRRVQIDYASGFGPKALS